MTKTEQKPVSNLALAAYLTYRGHSYIEVQRRGNRGTFMFSASPKLDEDMSTFLGGKASVEPAAYMETYRHLKAEVDEG